MNTELLKKIYLSSLLVFLLLLSGCSALQDSLKGETGNTGNTGATGPALTGNWIGYVGLIDDQGNKLTDLSGITVTVSNPTDLSALSLSSPKVAHTNTAGKFVITGLETGTYTLTLSKTGYGTIKFYNQPYTGGGDIVFSAIPGMIVRSYLSGLGSYSIVSSTINYLGDSYIRMNIETNLDANTFGNTRFARIFISTSSQVSSSNYLATYVDTASSISSHTCEFNFNFSDYNIVSGTQMYALVYPSGPAYVDNFLSGYYFDPTTGKNVYTNLGTPSEVIPFSR